MKEAVRPTDSNTIQSMKESIEFIVCDNDFKSNKDLFQSLNEKASDSPRFKESTMFAKNLYEAHEKVKDMEAKFTTMTKPRQSLEPRKFRM